MITFALSIKMQMHVKKWREGRHVNANINPLMPGVY